MTILLWVLFVLLIIFYSKFFLPIFERILGTIFVADLAEGISFFIVFVLSVITFAKFINGDFHIFFSNLFSNLFSKKNNNDIKDTQETESNIPSERRSSDKYYQAKKDAGLINVESGVEEAGLNNIESGVEESGGYLPKFFGLFFIILFSLIFLIVLTS